MSSQRFTVKEVISRVLEYDTDTDEDEDVSELEDASEIDENVDEDTEN